MTKKITVEDLLTPEKFDEVSRQIHEDARQLLVKQLAIDLAVPLPEEPETKVDALKNRTVLLAAIEEYNHRLTQKKPIKITEWDEIPDSNREWLLHNWLPANTVTMFTGQGGAGKSWLTLQVICQVACGFSERAFLDPDFQQSSTIEQNDRRPIVLATYEDEPVEIKRRLYALANGMSWIEESLDNIKRNVHIVDMRGVGSVWGPGMGSHISNTGDLLTVGEDLRRICEEKEARLLVMDPLSGAFGGNENDRTAVYDFVSSFRGWGETAKCATLVIGHLPKGAEARTAGFSGSTAWEASARSMWMLSKKTEDKKAYWALSHTKTNYAPLQNDILLIKDSIGWWRKAASTEDAIEGLKNYETELQSLYTDPYAGINL